MTAPRLLSLVRCVRWPLAALAMLTACGGTGQTAEDKAEAMVRATVDDASASFSEVRAHRITLSAGMHSTVVCGRVAAAHERSRRFMVGADAVVIEDGPASQAGFDSAWRSSCES